MSKSLEYAYRLGERDARLGYPSTGPIHPYTKAEFKAYRDGWNDVKASEGKAYMEGYRKAALKS